ncbi:A24 family peptidase [Klebsiella sp. BIGb0407]|uniref:prepilin peptidase n=1 Tax=Klebsiella sp. BIGb0407 TaxID=2940603 RepID=UPI00216A33A5|nr:A24 family peptidase [Klebsiella sp. BIGb0407]MCS3434583.1 prepilin signal peptidase PulO-like enzyme (type II secretory pathway) [Klebsiella sp. BIGb0407]
MAPSTLNIILVAGTSLYFSFAALLAFTDYKTGLLPDRLTLSLLWSGLIFHAITTPCQLDDAIYGAVIGYLSLWLLYWGFFWLCQREGLGYGDFKLLSAMGAWNGWQSLPIVLFVASMCGLATFAAVRVIRHKSAKQLPFGPSLAFAGWGEFVLRLWF